MYRHVIVSAVLLFASGHALDVSANKTNKTAGTSKKSSVTKDVGTSVAKRSELKRVTSLKYTVMKRNADGTETAIDETNYTFRLEDEFRLIVEADANLFVYVFHESIDGHRTFLVPDKYDPNGYVPQLVRGKALRIPRDGYFEVTPPGGVEKLMVFASPHKHPELTTVGAFSTPDELTVQQRQELKAKQDRVFQTAMHVLTDKSKPKSRASSKKKGTRRIRLRGLSWRPKSARARAGKTFVVESDDRKERPDLFLTSPLKSRQ
jgi:hypothetical protein